MKRFIIALILATTLISSSAKAEFYKEDYNKAIATARAKDETFVLLITASWCSPCQAQKRLIEQLEKDGKLPKKVHIAYVKYDSELAKKIKRGSSVPQLIRYEKVGDSWKKSVNIGYLNTQKLMEFIKNG